MTVNIGDFIFNIIKYLIALPQKLYEVINYPVSIEWVSKVLKFFGSDIRQIKAMEKYGS